MIDHLDLYLYYYQAKVTDGRVNLLCEWKNQFINIIMQT